MRLKPIRRSARQRALVDAAVVAYTQWRWECAAVRNAYRQWKSAGAFDRPLAFVAYNAALDREEGAAKLYARLMRRAGHLAEAGLARQLAQIQISSGAR
jgi:hypothetical protein